MKNERRNRRTADTTNALRYQLDMCVERGELQGMIVSDDSGMCLAAAGAEEVCEEIAATLPLIGRKIDRFDGVLLAGSGGRHVRMKSMDVSGGRLYVATIGGDAKKSAAELGATCAGVTRILAA